MAHVFAELQPQGLFSGNHYYCDGTQTAHSGWMAECAPAGNLVIGTAGNSATPEPGSLVLLGRGILAAGTLRHKLKI